MISTRVCHFDVVATSIGSVAVQLLGAQFFKIMICTKICINHNPLMIFSFIYSSLVLLLQMYTQLQVRHHP